MSKIILEAKNISKEYFSSYNQSCLALKDFNLEIHENEIICIVGESGSGKSTLLNLLSALTKPTNGEIYFRGQNLGLLKEDVLPDIGLDELKTILPDTSEEIENLLNFNKFDWTEPTQVEKGNNSSSKTLTLQLGEDVFQMWQDWLQQSGAKNESEAFYLLLKERNEEK